MIDKYRLDDLRLESGEKGELARWVIELQKALDDERRKYYSTQPNTMVPEELLSAMEEVLRISDRDHEAWHKAKQGIAACRATMLQGGNDISNGKPLTITLPDTSSKAFWGGTCKGEVFHPETYKRWVKEAIERYCAIARIEVRIK